MASQGAEKILYRSHDAYVAGVCAGIAEYLDFDAIVIRILVILLTFMTLGLAVIAYLILWAGIPRQPQPRPQKLYDVQPESAESTAYGSLDYHPGDGEPKLSILARVAIAAGLMLLFLVVAVNLSPLVPGTQWWQFWPLSFLILGLCLIIIPVRSRYEAAWHALGIVVTSLAASMLPMSVGVVSWHTIISTLALMWPIVVLAITLFIMGMYRGINALILASAFCIVGICVLGSTFCVLPGELETLLLYIPGGHSLQIVVPH